MSKDFWEDDAKPQAAGFWEDDTALPESETVNPLPERSSKLDAAVRGAAQGVWGGLPDEITAGVGAVKDKVGGSPLSLGDLYKSWKRTIQKGDDIAHDEHPGVYTGAQVAGTLTGLGATGALNAAKGAGLAANIGKGALGGALVGFGESRTDEPGGTMFDSPEALWGTAKDTVGGAALGAGTAGVLHGAGKAAKAFKDAARPERVASVMLNAPEEAVGLYLKDAGRVNAAKPTHEYVDDLLKNIGKLQDEVSSGSQTSRDILAIEGKQVKGSDLAKILNDKADDIAIRSEGAMNDPGRAAAYKWLKKHAGEFQPGKDEMDPVSGLMRQADPSYSTNRVKDFLQTIDRSVDYELAPGTFGRIDEGVKKGVRHDVDAMLKGLSPEYAEQMKGVAADTGLLKEASGLAKTDQGFANLLKRVQRERAPFAAETVGKVDKRMGTNLLEDLKYAQAKEALDKGATNGSRNVNLYANVLGEKLKDQGVPFGKAIGTTVGATVDKYGPAMGKQLIDVTRRLQSSEGLQSLGRFAKPLAEAAKRGNNALAVTHVLLMKDPEYAAQFADGTGP